MSCEFSPFSRIEQLTFVLASAAFIAGFELRAVCQCTFFEIDKYACKTYQHLYGDNPENDLTSDEFNGRWKARNMEAFGWIFKNIQSVPGCKKALKTKKRG